MSGTDPFTAVLHQPSQTGLWSGNIKLARKLVELAQSSKDEAPKDMYYRAATSKVYYALYHYALYYAKHIHSPETERFDRPIRPGQEQQEQVLEGAHQRLITWYKDASIAAIKTSLESGKKLRVVVDYHENYYYQRKDYVDAETCCKDVYKAVTPAMKRLQEMIQQELESQSS